jgi:hypothetical protein
MCSNVCGQICNVEKRLELFEAGEVGCFRGQLVQYRDDSLGEKRIRIKYFRFAS